MASQHVNSPAPARLRTLVGADIPASLEPVTAERLTAVLRTGRVLAVVGAIGLLLAHFTNALLLDHQVPGLDANHENNPLTWASSTVTAMVAAAALVAAIMTGPRVPLVVLAAGAGFLSMDDMLALHERISLRIVSALDLAETWDSLLWPALYLPLLVVTALLILRMNAIGTLATFRHAVFGLGLLVAAVALEVVTAPWSSGTNLMHTVQGGLEEALELSGWTIIATATMATMLANVVRQATAGEHR